MFQIRRVFAAVLAVAALAAAPASWAMEPDNDSAPWTWWEQKGNTTVYSPKTSASYFGSEQISPTSDVDYIVATCGNTNMKWTSIGFTHAAGDIDMWVYDLSGNLLATSTGVTDEERVDLSALGKQAVAIRVYGYNGAQNGYYISVFCS